VDERIKDTIVKYGWKILQSKEFDATFRQTHHLNRTVGDHTLGVAAEAVKLCMKRAMTDERTLKNVVVSSLCHDLGIMGRNEKYRNNAQCLVRHPLDSIEIYIRITGEQDERVIDAIKHHMFPLKPGAPRHREGWILTLADKIAASKEKTGRAMLSAGDTGEIMERAGVMHEGKTGMHSC
jgi:uncharacterized protein